MAEALTTTTVSVPTCPAGPQTDGGGRSRVRRSDVDGGWAWVVLVASFLSNTISYGHYMNGGIYFVAFLKAFGQSRSHTAWIYSAQLITTHGAGPICGIMISRFGPRMTMISASVLSSLCLMASYFAQSVIELVILFAIIGLGLSLTMTCSLAVIPVYFDRHFGWATGLTNSGAGVGFMVLGLLMEWAMDTFGWRGSMLIQAGIFLQMAACGALFFPVAARRTLPATTRVGARRRPVWKSACRDVRFFLIMASFLFYFVAMGVMMLVLKDSFPSDGAAAAYGTVLVGFGAANTAGRLAGGLLPGRLCNPLVQYLAYSAVAAANSVAILFVGANPWLYVACASVFGFCTGALSVLQALSLAFVFGSDAMSVLWGFAITTGVASTLLGAPLAGYMVDVSGSYSGAFALVSICILMSGLSTIFCYLMIHQRSRKFSQKTETDNMESIQQKQQECQPLSAQNGSTKE